MIRLAFIDDHEITARGLAAFFEEYGLYQVKHVAVWPQQAIDQFDWENVDVLVSDIRMGDISGFDMVRFVKTNHPHIVTVLYSFYNTAEYTIEAKLCGADEFLLRDGNMGYWREKLDNLMSGGATDLSQVSVAELKKEMMSLTIQERAILRHCMDGLSAEQSATQLNRSVSTVRTHRNNIIQKLEAKNMYEAITKALSEGLLKP